MSERRKEAVWIIIDFAFKKKLLLLLTTPYNCLLLINKTLLLLDVTTSYFLVISATFAKTIEWASLMYIR